MSSSVFKVFPSSSSSAGPDEERQPQTRSSTTGDGEGASGVDPGEDITDERLKIDSNLVIVVAKDGSVHVDQKTLHSLLANETNDTSVSVVRITSPTPSIEAEIEEDRRLMQEQKLQQDLESTEADSESEDDDSDESPGSSNAGSGSSAATPASSSSSSAPAVGASKSETAPASAGPSGVTTRRGRQVAKKEDVLLDDDEIPHVSMLVEGFYPPTEAKKFASEVLTLAGLRKPLSVETTIDYDFRRYVVANDHCYTPLTSPSQKLPPRPSYEDLDSSTEMRSGGKTTTGAAEVKPAASQSVEGTTSGIAHRRRSCKITSPPPVAKTRTRKSISQKEETNDAEDLQSILEDTDSDYTEESSYPDEDDSDSDLDFLFGGKKPKKRKSVRKNKSGSKTPVKKDDSQEGRNHKKQVQSKTPKKTESKLVSPVSMVNKSAIPKTYGSKRDLTKQEPAVSSTPIPVVAPAPAPVPVQVVIVKKEKKPPKPAPHEEALFSDMTSLFSTPDIIKKVGSNRTIIHQQTPMASASNSTRGFVQISPASAKGGAQKLPAQISIQTHTSTSEEQDKRLDLIDSIVQQELNQPAKHSQHTSVQNTSTVLNEDIVKILENNLPPVGVQEPVLPITDNSILAALGSNDDGLPEDLLQHVAELAEHKELQEILDKQVLGVIGGTDGSIAPLSNMPSTSAVVPMPSVQQQPQTAMQPQSVTPQPTVSTASNPESLPTMTVKEQLMPRKEAIQIRRSDGRIITLPPIEAPATRSAKRRAQAGTPSSAASSPAPVAVRAVVTTPSTPVAASSHHQSGSVPKAAKHSASTLSKATAGGISYDNGSGSLLIDETPRGKAASGNRSGASSRRTSESSSTSGRSKRQSTTAVAAVVAAEADDDVESDKSWNSEDDPDRLWCICRQPHNNRFMICCDVCEDWFHGKCVNITKAMGQQMEADGIDWTCPVCLKKKLDKQQPKMTEYLVSSSSSGTNIAIIKAPASPTVANTSVTGCVICSKPARVNSAYCSDICIRKHAGLANESVPMRAAENYVKDRIKEEGKKVESPTKVTAKAGPIIVMERKTGRCLTGQNAPTSENLKAWLQSHPTFEVVPPGSPQAAIILAKQAEVRKLQLAREAQRKAAASGSGSAGHQHGSKVQSQLKFTDQKKLSITSPTAAQHKQSSTPQTKQQGLKPSPKGLVITPPLKTVQTVAQRAPGGITSKTPSTSTTPTMSNAISKQQQQQQKRTVPEAKSSKTPPTPAGENIRVTVKKTLKELLLQRTAELTNKTAIHLNEQEVDTFVAEIEGEMFALFNKDTGTKYRAKYRSLVFNIKDRKNLSLFQKICEKRIEAKQLVRMTADELASQELAQWRENENKHQLEMIKKSELDLLACAKNYVLKTHKGEEVIEGKSDERVQLDPTTAVEDVVAVLNNSTVSSTSELDNTTISPSKDGIYKSKDYDSYGKYSSGLYSSTPITSTTLSSSTATTSSANAVPASTLSKKKDSKRDRSRSKSRDRRRDRSRSRSKHKRRRSRSRSRHASRDRDRGRDRYRDHKRRDSRDKDQKTVVEKVKDKEASSATSDKDRNEAVGKPIEAKKQYSKKSPIPSKPQTQGSYNLIDKILASGGSSGKSPANNPSTKTDKNLSDGSKQDSALATSVEQDQEPTSTVTIPTPPHSTTFDNESPTTDFAEGVATDLTEDAKKKALTVHWSGNVHMVDVASVEMSIRSVSGDVEDIVRDFAEDLDICGTIKPEIVWDYIAQIKKSPNKEICLVRFHSNESAAYYTLYSHLFSRKRYSVIKSPSSLIKDFYIFPLPSEQMVPMILKPLRGVGIIEGDKKPDLLLGIIVKIRGSKRSSTTSTAGSVPTKTSRRQSKSTTSSSSTAVSPSFALMQQVITKYATKKAELDQVTRDNTPPGSPGTVVQSAKQSVGAATTVAAASKTASVSSAKATIPRRSASESPEQVDVDMDIIKGPITAKVALKDTTSAVVIDDDDDEPYSPGGASDDSDNFADVTAIVETKPGSTQDTSKSVRAMESESERIRLEMEEINRKIAEEKNEIVGIISKAELREDDIKSTLPPSLITDIAIPSNLSEILASIKGVPLAVEKSKALPRVVDEDSASTSVPMEEDDEEYVPTAPANYSSYKSGYSYGTAGTSNLVVLANDQSQVSGKTSSTTSKLSTLSEEELLSMVPDDSYLQPVPKTGKTVPDDAMDIDSDTDSSAPLKQSKWKSNEPPPPGMEDDNEPA